MLSACFPIRLESMYRFIDQRVHSSVGAPLNKIMRRLHVMPGYRNGYGALAMARRTLRADEAIPNRSVLPRARCFYITSSDYRHRSLVHTKRIPGYSNQWTKSGKKCGLMHQD